MAIYEIKASQTILPTMFENMNQFTEIAQPSETRTIRKHLVYAGKENQKRTHASIIAWDKLGEWKPFLKYSHTIFDHKKGYPIFLDTLYLYYN